MYITELLKFARMLSVSVIRFEDRFCVSRKVRHRVGEDHPLDDSASWLLRLPVEELWSALGGLFFCFLAQTGVENLSFTL